MPEIVHVTVAPDLESYTEHLDDDTWAVYWLDEKSGCVVRNLRWITDTAQDGAKLKKRVLMCGEVKTLTDSWLVLLENAEHHPKHWKSNKAKELVYASSNRLAERQG